MAIPNFCCDADYNGDGYLNRLDSWIYHQFVNWNTAHSGSQATVEGVKSLYMNQVTAGKYVTSSFGYGAEVIHHLPDFECSNFNSNLVGTGSNRDATLNRLDSWVYHQYVNWKTAHPGQEPQPRDVQTLFDNQVNAGRYAPVTIVLLPQLVPVDCGVCTDETSSISCPLTCSSFYNQSITESAHACSTCCLEEASRLARLEAEYVALHLLSQQCDCSSSCYVASESYTAICPLTCSGNYSASYTYSSSFCSTCCLAEAEAVAYENAKTLALYDMVANCTGSCGDIYISTQVCTASCPEPYNDIFVVKVATEISLINQLDADTKARNRACYLAEYALENDCYCGHIPKVFVSTQTCSISCPPPLTGSNVLQATAISYISQEEADYLAQEKACAEVADSLTYGCFCTCDSTQSVFITCPPACGSGSNITVIGTGSYQSYISCEDAQLQANNLAYQDAYEKFLLIGCSCGCWATASYTAYCQCLTDSSSSIDPVSASAIRYSPFDCETAEAIANIAAQQLAESELKCVYNLCVTTESFNGASGKISINGADVSDGSTCVLARYDIPVTLRVWDIDSGSFFNYWTGSDDTGNTYYVPGETRSFDIKVNCNTRLTASFNNIFQTGSEESGGGGTPAVIGPKDNPHPCELITLQFSSNTGNYDWLLLQTSQLTMVNGVNGQGQSGSQYSCPWEIVPSQVGGWAFGPNPAERDHTNVAVTFYTRGPGTNPSEVLYNSILPLPTLDRNVQFTLKFKPNPQFVNNSTDTYTMIQGGTDCQVVTQAPGSFTNEGYYNTTGWLSTTNHGMNPPPINPCNQYTGNCTVETKCIHLTENCGASTLFNIYGIVDGPHDLDGNPAGSPCIDCSYYVVPSTMHFDASGNPN